MKKKPSGNQQKEITSVHQSSSLTLSHLIISLKKTLDSRSEVFPRMVKESNNKVRLTGSWLTEIGELDTAGKYHSPLLGILGSEAFLGMNKVDGAYMLVFVSL